MISTITLSDTIDDANPADVSEDFITHPRYGAAPNLNIADLSNFVLIAEQPTFLLVQHSPNNAAYETINEIVEAVNCAVVPSPDGLKIRSFGDSAITGTGVTLLQISTPVYHLIDDDFIGDDETGKSDAVAVILMLIIVQIEYINRYNQYNTEKVEAKDQAILKCTIAYGRSGQRIISL